MHLQILSRGDYFANHVQWFSMIGSSLCISLIGKELGLGLRGQIFSAVIAATIPMGIAQAASTQTDYVVTFWLVCFIYYAVLLRRGSNKYYAVAGGASLGLAILSTGTAYIYALPFVIWFILMGVIFRGKKLIKDLVVTSIVVLSLNISHDVRNYNVFGNPVTTDSVKLADEDLSLSNVISNGSRNLSFHIGTPFGRINSVMKHS